MSDNKNKQAEDQEKKGAWKLSRREFLKDAGLVIGSSTVGSIAFSGKAEADTAERAENIPESDNSVTIELTINGGKYRYRVETNWSLRQLLRDEAGLTSPKDWCGGHGACGSCTVIMNGRPVLSCMTVACECDGAVIETAEGIAKEKHPVIDAYIKWNAFQCGYCTPGFITSAKALLDRNPNPTETDVRDALGGNLCRCATYQQHPPAVLEAAGVLRNKKSK